MAVPAPEAVRRIEPAQAGDLFLPDVWIDNAFQRRFAAVLEGVLEDRGRHVVGAVTGAGKTTGIEAFTRRHPVVKSLDGQSAAPVIAALSTDELERSRSALLRRMAMPLNTIPRMSVTALEDWLLEQFTILGTRVLLFDDSQDFGFGELRRIKKLMDRLKLQFHAKPGLVLIAASQGSIIPVRDLLVTSENDHYRQFRGRFSRESPWIYVPALAELELSEVLSAYEEILSPQLGSFSIEPWASRIYQHLTSAYFDPFVTERVTMLSLENVVLGIAGRLLASDSVKVTGELIDEVARALAVGTEVVVAQAEFHEP